jgi:hypothetical protein
MQAALRQRELSVESLKDAVRGQGARTGVIEAVGPSSGSQLPL